MNQTKNDTLSKAQTRKMTPYTREKQDSDFRFRFFIIMHYLQQLITVLQKLQHLKGEKNITIHNQNKMCSISFRVGH